MSGELVEAPAAQLYQRVVAGDSAQVAALGSGTQIVNFISTPARMPPVPGVALNSLPRDIVYFIDRDEMLERISAVATRMAGIDDAESVIVIDGMAGVGKTALAIRAAHRLASAFPDSQLYLDLHAYSQNRTPVEPASALETLLRVLGVAGEEIPVSLDGRAALWRSYMAGRRSLVVLDNAASTHQVAPLLPGSPGCLVIITSRQQHAGLAGSVQLSLDVLLSDDAARLFTRIVGAERASQDDGAVRRVVESCAQLPLAVSLCAARLKYRSSWTTQDLVADLTRGPSRVGAIRTEGGAVSDVFALSYRGLNAEQQHTFRRLGLHPAQEFGGGAAAALDGDDPSTVNRRLEDLCDRNLLQQPRFGRYVLHDLLHEYAASLAEEIDPAADRALAIDRLLDYYASVATRADQVIDLLGSRELEVDWTPAEPATFGSHVEAIAWLETERANLQAMINLAVDTDRAVRACQLARAVVYFLRLRGSWGDVVELCQWIAPVADQIGERARAADLTFYHADILRLTGQHDQAMQQYDAALTAYRSLADRHREARTLHSMGDIDRAAGQFTRALDRYHAALAAYRDLGRTLAEARARHSIADTYRVSGRRHEAIDHYHAALDIYGRLNDPVGEARVRHSMGDLRRLAGEYDQALADAQTALDAFRRLGDRLGEADAEFAIGEIQQALRSHAASLGHYRRARATYRGLGDRRGYARALWRSGSVLVAAGHAGSAAPLLAEALATFRDLGAAAEAEQVREELDGIG